MPKVTKEAKEQREVLYPRLLTRIHAAGLPPCPEGVDKSDWPYRPPLTIEQAKDILHWQTEEEYAAELLKENAKLKPHELTFPEPLLRDMHGNKVMCWRNTSNRTFNLDWALSIAQDRLNGNWRINGEALIIGRTGLALSVQHRLIGFILADQKRELDDEWRARWPEPLTLECYISMGLPEDQKTVNTLDNTLARTDADAIRTIGLFNEWKVRDKVGKDSKEKTVERTLSNSERKWCERIYAKATELLWLRVGAGDDERHGYQTHSESAAFRDRHPRLLKAVQHIFEEDWDGHPISKKGLSAGQSAACLYLMGSSSSDPTKYHGVDDQPGESLLKWDHWDRACEFWAELAAGKLKSVETALANPYGLKEATEAGGIEKLCVLAKAWSVCVTGKHPTAEQLKLKHIVDDVGVVKLDEKPGFGGADLGPKHEPATDADELVQEANQRGVGVGVVMDERKAAASAKSVSDLQVKLDAAKAKKVAAKTGNGATIAGQAFAKLAVPEKPSTARVTVPVVHSPTHPAGKRVPLGTAGVGKPAPSVVKPVATTTGQPPGAVVVRPATKFPTKLGAPGKPKGLGRTV